MYINLLSIRKFSAGGATAFELPLNILRYEEFDNVVVFLLDEGNGIGKIVGVKFSQEGGVNHFYIDWEFKVIDYSGCSHSIDYMKKKIHNGMGTIHCHGRGYDMEFYLDPNSGEITEKHPTKW